jgi:hypothetical protein
MRNLFSTLLILLVALPVLPAFAQEDSTQTQHHHYHRHDNNGSSDSKD